MAIGFGDGSVDPGSPEDEAFAHGFGQRSGVGGRSAVLAADDRGERHRRPGFGDLDGAVLAERRVRDEDDVARVDAGDAVALVAQVLDLPLDDIAGLDGRSINAKLLVSPDGVVTLFSVHTTGNTAGHPVELTLSVMTDGVGSTSVAQPVWVDEA